MPRYNKHSDIEKATAIARVIQDSERQVGQWHASGPAVGRRRVRAVQAPAAQRDPQAHDGNGVDEHQQGDVHAHRVVRVGHGYARVKRHFWLQGMWSLPPVARGHARAHESLKDGGANVMARSAAWAQVKAHVRATVLVLPPATATAQRKRKTVDVAGRLVTRELVENELSGRAKKKRRTSVVDEEE
jgi:hypothetical protein